MGIAVMLHVSATLIWVGIVVILGPGFWMTGLSGGFKGDGISGNGQEDVILYPLT